MWRHPGWVSFPPACLSKFCSAASTRTWWTRISASCCKRSACSWKTSRNSIGFEKLLSESMGTPPPTCFATPTRYRKLRDYENHHLKALGGSGIGGVPLDSHDASCYIPKSSPEIFVGSLESLALLPVAAAWMCTSAMLQKNQPVTQEKWCPRGSKDFTPAPDFDADIHDWDVGPTKKARKITKNAVCARHPYFLMAPLSVVGWPLSSDCSPSRKWSQIGNDTRTHWFTSVLQKWSTPHHVPVANVWFFVPAICSFDANQSAYSDQDKTQVQTSLQPTLSLQPMDPYFRPSFGSFAHSKTEEKFNSFASLRLSLALQFLQRSQRFFTLLGLLAKLRNGKFLAKRRPTTVTLANRTFSSFCSKSVFACDKRATSPRLGLCFCQEESDCHRRGCIVEGMV